MVHPTGESKDGVLKLDFDRRLMLQFRGSVITSDAGLLAYRELDDALGLSAIAGETLADARTGKNTAKHRIFSFLKSEVISESKIVNLASDDAWVLGVLSSRPHIVFARQASNHCKLLSSAKGEVSSGQNREDESTDAEHRGGVARSRDEGPVMGPDRRGCVVQPRLRAN